MGKVVLKMCIMWGKELPLGLTTVLVAGERSLSLRNFEQRGCHCEFSTLM